MPTIPIFFSAATGKRALNADVHLDGTGKLPVPASSKHRVHRILHSIEVACQRQRTMGSARLVHSEAFRSMHPYEGDLGSIFCGQTYGLCRMDRVSPSTSSVLQEGTFSIGRIEPSSEKCSGGLQY